MDFHRTAPDRLARVGNDLGLDGIQVRRGQVEGGLAEMERTIKELEAKRFIKVTRKGLGKPNTYELFLTATKAPARKRRTSR